MNILLIEDEEIAAKCVVSALTSDGHKCTVITTSHDYHNNILANASDDVYNDSSDDYSNAKKRRAVNENDDDSYSQVNKSSYDDDEGSCDDANDQQYNKKRRSPASQYNYDLVILDLHLPGEYGEQDAGFSILKKIRNARIQVPVLILSDFSSPAQKVKALSVGADDYLTKPFYHAELLARIKAVVRRTVGHAESVISIGNINVNFDNRFVDVNGEIVPLTAKEYAMMELLALRKGVVITKETFLQHLYNGVDEPSQDKIVDVFMCKLRSKLKKANNGKNHIETVWGRGYVLKEYIDDEYIYNEFKINENTKKDYSNEKV